MNEIAISMYDEVCAEVARLTKVLQAADARNIQLATERADHEAARARHLEEHRGRVANAVAHAKQQARAEVLAQCEEKALEWTKCSCWDCPDECANRRRGAERVLDDIRALAAGAESQHDRIARLQRNVGEVVQAVHAKLAVKHAPPSNRVRKATGPDGLLNEDDPFLLPTVTLPRATLERVRQYLCDHLPETPNGNLDRVQDREREACRDIIDAALAVKPPRDADWDLEPDEVKP